MKKLHKAKLEKSLRAFKADICVNTVFCEEGALFPELRDGSIKVLESHGVKYALFPQIERRGCWAFVGKIVDAYKRSRYEEMPRNYNHFVVLSPAHIEQWKGYHNISAIVNMCTLETGGQVANLETKVVSILARLAPEKNIASLVNAWAKVATKHPDWQLHIWGDGALREEVERQITTMGLGDSVLLRGETNDVLSAYLGSSISVLSSKHEGFPMTLIEAQTVGLPIVSYDCPLGPRSIIHDGKDGYLVEPGNEEALAEKLILLIENQVLRLHMGRQALKSAEAYQPQKVMAQWEKLFAQLIDGSRAKP